MGTQLLTQPLYFRPRASNLRQIFLSASVCLAISVGQAQELSTNAPAKDAEQLWNFHAQNTDIVQYHPGITSPYSGPNSLSSASEVKETVSLGVIFGLRLWRGAEFHVDGLMWQGFGLSDACGIDGFPNGEAFRLGTEVPNGSMSRIFIRQIIGLGGEQETVEDDQLQLAGYRDISRVTLTVGRMSAKDIFENNTYANDSRSQFMSWAFMANEAWDYPGDSLGYITGLAAELNQPKWTLRYGFFQIPSESNGLSWEDKFLKWPYDSSAGSGPFLLAWGMVTEFERRYYLNNHPGISHRAAGAYGAHSARLQHQRTRRPAAVRHQLNNPESVAPFTRPSRGGCPPGPR